MKIEILSTSDLETKGFAKGLINEINSDNEKAISLTFNEKNNFNPDTVQAAILIFITEKVGEKIIDYLYEKIKNYIEKEEKYDIDIDINIDNKTYNFIDEEDEVRKATIKNH